MPTGGTDHDIARALAEDAGRLLLDLRDAMARDGAVQHEIKDAGDRQSHLFLMEALGRLRPDDAVLSEEGKDDLVRLESERVWIIDPLDGTREYGEGRHDWAVHVALAIDGAPVCGAVALPGARHRLDTGTSPSSRPAPRGGRVRIAVSRSRPPAMSKAVAERDRRRARAHGIGRRSRRWRWSPATSTPTSTPAASTSGTPAPRWPSPSPPAFTPAASTARRSTYNHADPYLPDLVICRPELADQVLEVVGRYA